MDAAGEVDEIGEGTDTELHVGDAAMAIVVPDGSHGAYAEYVVVPAASAVRAPSGASAAEAATLPMNAMTARLALDTLALVPGQTLAVTGAASALGGYVVQLAKTDRLTVVADASEADEQLVRELGADVVVRRGDDVAARIREGRPGGVDGLVDGSVQGDALLPAVRDGGRSPPCAVTAAPTSAASPRTRCSCATSRPTTPRWTSCAARPRRAC